MFKIILLLIGALIVNFISVIIIYYLFLDSILHIIRKDIDLDTEYYLKTI